MLFAFPGAVGPGLNELRTEVKRRDYWGPDYLGATVLTPASYQVVVVWLKK